MGQMGKSFNQQRKAFSGTQQGDDPNRQIMRDDYGWKMTEAQYSALQKDKSVFEKSLQDYRKTYNQRIEEAKRIGNEQITKEQSQYNQWKAQFANEYSTNKKAFDAAKKRLGSTPTTKSLFDDYWAKRRMKVSVWDGQKRQGTYWVPRDAVNFLHKQMDGQYTGKGEYLMSVRQGGRMRGQEVHDMLRNEYGNKNYMYNKFLKEPEFQGTYKDKVNQYKRALSDHNKQLSLWQQTVQKDRNALSQFNERLAMSRQQLAREEKLAGIQRDTDIGRAENRRKGQIDAAREAYQIRSEARRKAYQNMAKMTTGAKPKPQQAQPQQAQPQPQTNQGEQ